MLPQEQAVSAQKRAQRLDVELAEARLARNAAESEAAMASTTAEQRIQAVGQKTTELLAKAAAEREAVCGDLKAQLADLERRETDLQSELQEAKDAVKVGTTLR